MLARTRTRTRSELFGSVWERVNGALVDRTGPLAAVTYYKSTADFHKKVRRLDGTLPPSDLTITEKEISPPVFNLREFDRYDARVYQDFRNCPFTLIDIAGWSPNSKWSTIEDTDTYYLAKLLADSNPFNYSVSIPIMISELVEASTLLRVVQTNILTLGGSSYLNYQFGIAPLIADLKVLATITTAIENKIKELNSVIKRGGLRKKVFLSNRVYHTPSELRYAGWSGYAKTLHYTIKPTYRSKVWGTVRWKPSSPSTIDVSKLASFNMALKTVFDLKTVKLGPNSPEFLKLNPSTIWEMIPFSWLADYFLNVGDSLRAVEETDLVTPYDICIMRTRTIETEARVEPKWWFNAIDGALQRSAHWSNGSTRITIKLRKTGISPPSSASSLLSFGFMTKGQATNLAALLLSISRFR